MRLQSEDKACVMPGPEHSLHDHNILGSDVLWMQAANQSHKSTKTHRSWFLSPLFLAQSQQLFPDECPIRAQHDEWIALNTRNKYASTVLICLLLELIDNPTIQICQSTEQISTCKHFYSVHILSAKTMTNDFVINLNKVNDFPIQIQEETFNL